jgi:hypothetical protein
MPWFRSAPRKPVGRRVSGREWAWTWEPEPSPGRGRRWWLLGAVALAAVVVAVGLTLGFTLSDDGGGESPPSSAGEATATEAPSPASEGTPTEAPSPASEGTPTETPFFVDLAEAISVSHWDGSTPEGSLFVNRCDVYLTTGRTEATHSLPDGDYVFQVTDVSGDVLLSTDEVRLRQVQIADGVLRGVSGQGRHGMGGDGVGGATTVQLCPFDESPDASGEYRLWLTPVEDFRGDLGAVDSAAGDFHDFLVNRSLVVVFDVMPRR